MITSKKGIESFPFFLFLTVFIAAFVLTIGFHQINLFSNFSSQRELTNSYKEMRNSMENLRATTDQGSFTRVNLNIPSNHNITFSTKEDTIRIHGPNFDLNNTPGFNITNIIDENGNSQNNLTLKDGIYEITLYYGNGEFNGNGQPKGRYQIYFV